MKKLIVASLFFLAACASADPPAVHSAGDAKSDATAPAAGMARVVLIRPESQCDSSAYPIVVDENAHFVGQLSQNSRAAIEMPPGDHILFAWPSVDARVEKYPDFDPVGVVRLHLNPGETRYVEVTIPHRSSAQCWHITTFGLRHLASSDTDLQGWLAETRLIAIDRAAGDADLARDPATVQTHIASGRRELEHRQTMRGERINAQNPPDAPPDTDDRADSAVKQGSSTSP